MGTQTTVVSVRLDPEIVERIQAVAAELKRRAAGAPIAMTVPIRMALERGLPALEREIGINPKGKRTRK